MTATAARDLAARDESFAPSSILVGEVEITPEEILQEVQYHPAPSFETACHEAARSLVIRILLLERARESGLFKRLGSDSSTLGASQQERDEQQAIARLLDQDLPVEPVTTASCEAFYAAARDRFRGPELFSASHILILGPADDVETRASARERAEQLLEDLARAPERFEALARKYSGCPSARSGGALGQIEPGESPAPFEAALRALQPGELASHPIETEHGFHVLRLDARAPGHPLPFAAVRDKIQIYLRDRQWRQALRDYIEKLAAKTTIRGFELS